jgi:hypothetical protein
VQERLRILITNQTIDGIDMIFYLIMPLKQKDFKMTKIIMIPVTFGITAFAFCCLASPFLVMGKSFIKGFIG